MAIEFELTEIEKQAGVTIEDVERFAQRSLAVRNKIFIDDVGPALAGAVARFVGRLAYPGYDGPWSFAGYNQLGHAVYEKEKQ